MNKGILVYIDTVDGRPSHSGLELLSKARQLGEAWAVLLGAEAGSETVAQLLREYGASRILVDANPAYDDYLTLPAVDALQEIVQREQPAAVLFVANASGKDLSPRLASRLGSGLLTDAIALEWVEGSLQAQNSALGGTVLASYRAVDDGLVVATVRPKSFEAEPEEVPSSAAVEQLQTAPAAASLLSRILGLAGERSGSLSLEEADVIVSGGRGMGGPENFTILRELAAELNGVVGASRAAVDAGWMPGQFQVGQTGKTVKPKLYIACGISGAIQHKVGMQGADHIVAINKDPEAAIFRFADLGIVGDLFEVVPQLTAELRARRAAG